MKKVFVIDRQFEIITMFGRTEGFVCVANPSEANIIVWPGGSDVNPKLYGQKEAPEARCNIHDLTDQRDIAYWNEYRDKGKLFVGICRGGQFLNVMNEGTMWQHTNNHAIGRTHKLIDLMSDNEWLVTSTHHQMMRANPLKGQVLGIAYEATHWIDDCQNIGCSHADKRPKEVPPFDTEVVWYKDTRSLCFQPHPEFTKNAEATKKYFFNLVEMVL